MTNFPNTIRHKVTKWRKNRRSGSSWRSIVIMSSPLCSGCHRNKGIPISLKSPTTTTVEANQQQFHQWQSSVADNVWESIDWERCVEYCLNILFERRDTDPCSVKLNVWWNERCNWQFNRYQCRKVPSNMLTNSPKDICFPNRTRNMRWKHGWKSLWLFNLKSSNLFNSERRKIPDYLFQRFLHAVMTCGIRLWKNWNQTSIGGMSRTRTPFIRTFRSRLGVCKVRRLRWVCDWWWLLMFSLARRDHEIMEFFLLLLISLPIPIKVTSIDRTFHWLSSVKSKWHPSSEKLISLCDTIQFFAHKNNHI
jgi:hypothetical protein